jgi:methyl-accepting chemotaxis protein-1 (serine sensor receptor)
MSFIASLRVRPRLLGSFGLVLLLLVAVAWLGVSALSKSYAMQKEVFDNNIESLRQLDKISYLTQRNRVLVMDALMNPEPGNIQKRTEEMAKNAAEIDRQWKTYLATEKTAEEHKLIPTFETALNAYRSEGLVPAREALTANDIDKARGHYRDISRLAPKLNDVQLALIELQVHLAEQDMHEAEASFHSTRQLIIGFAVIALAVGAVLAVVIARSITTPVSQAVGVARRVADGDLSESHIERRGDELGDLLTALGEMRSELRGIVSRVRQGADGVATGSREIATGNQDLSARTENQASALEETASAMEELGATVGHNADAAQQANQLAQAASTVAVRGGDQVADVVSTMNDIHVASRKISDIIGTIDGIAFQTNILALNAAVEAARAGEQGRGFAVVAGEVRLLAQRSAEAAREIKSLIAASVERVERGTHIVNEAGTTMTEVVDSIRRVTDLMGEISSASQEQSRGVAQVGEAVTSMDQTTQQNAALVEQMAAAATSLRQQADELVGTMARFRF